MLFLSIATHAQKTNTAMRTRMDVSHVLKINTGITQNVLNVVKTNIGKAIIRFVFATKDGTKILILYALNVVKTNIGMRMIKNVIAMQV